MPEILVIDDDPAIRRIIVRILGGADHRVCEAANGREGIALLRETHPALVITDIVMPDMEGIETILALKQIVPEVSILAISGLATGAPNYLDMAAELGADATLSKPFGASELLAAIERLLV